MSETLARRKLDAVILAGEKEGSIPILGGNKAFLPFGDKPLIGLILEALEAAKTVATVTVVGPLDRLEEQLGGYPIKKPLKFVAQGRNIFDNIWRGSLSTFPDLSPDSSMEEARGSAHSDQALLLLTCDMPLLDPREIDAFINTAPLDRADIVYGYTEKRLLEPYEPRDGQPGINFIYAAGADLIVRHSNVACYRPLKLASFLERVVPVMYGLRYQRHVLNMLRASLSLFRLTLKPNAIALFFLLEAASYAYNHGHLRLCDLFRKPLTLAWAESVCSDFFQTPFATNPTIGPGLTLDVDDEPSYRAFLERFDEWKQLQNRQLEAALNPIAKKSS